MTVPFSLRLPPELHRRTLAGVSLNAWILSLLDAGAVSAEALERLREDTEG